MNVLNWIVFTIWLIYLVVMGWGWLTNEIEDDGAPYKTHVFVRILIGLGSFASAIILVSGISNM